MSVARGLPIQRAKKLLSFGPHPAVTLGRQAAILEKMGWGGQAISDRGTTVQLEAFVAKLMSDSGAAEGALTFRLHVGQPGLVSVS